MRNNEDETKEQLTEKQISFTGQTTNHVHKTREELQFQVALAWLGFHIFTWPRLMMERQDNC